MDSGFVGQFLGLPPVCIGDLRLGMLAERAIT